MPPYAEAIHPGHFVTGRPLSPSLVRVRNPSRE